MTKFLIYIVATAILVLLGTDAYLVATGKGTPTEVPKRRQLWTRTSNSTDTSAPTRLQQELPSPAKSWKSSRNGRKATP